MTTLREFARSLAWHRRAVASGREVIVRDSQGAMYVFKRINAPARTMADYVGHLAGQMKTGNRVKTLAGYSRR